MSSQSVEQIWFLDASDQPVQVHVAPSGGVVSDQEILQSARDLRDKNIKPNWKCFQRLGYSRKAIRDFRETEVYRNICAEDPKLMPRQVLRKTEGAEGPPSKKRKTLHPPPSAASEESEEEGEMVEADGE